MKSKSKIILSAILTIVLCVSVVTGATLALFTSESKVNIAVTSGTVDVQAYIDENATFALSSLGVDQTDTFANGGTVSYNTKSNTLTLTNITPGDRVVFPVTLLNNSNVATKFRVGIVIDGDVELKDNILFGYEQGNQYKYVANELTDWQDAPTAGQPFAQNFAIELPAYVGNQAQTQSCQITIKVEAVQANGVANSGAESVVPVIVATTPDEFNALSLVGVTQATIVLYGNDATVWQGASLNLASDEQNANYTIRGWNVDTLTVNVPNGEVHVYNDCTVINAQAVANQSLHLFAQVQTLVVNQGHVVVELGANVELVQVEATADVSIHVDPAVVEQDGVVVESASVAKINVVSVADSASVALQAPQEVLDNVDVAEDIIDSVETSTASLVCTLDELQSAFASSSYIKLGADFVINEEKTSGCAFLVGPNADITLDLNGHSISGTVCATKNYSLISVQGTLTVIGNGTLALVNTDGSQSYAFSSSVIGLNNHDGYTVDTLVTLCEGVNIVHNGGTCMAYGVDLVTYTGCEVIIDGANINSAYIGVRMFGNNGNKILTVNSGNVHGTRLALWIQHTGNSDIDLTVNGGTLSGKGGIMVSTYAESCQPVDVVLNGGINNATQQLELSLNASASIIPTISKAEGLSVRAPEGYQWNNNVLEAVVSE